MSTTFELRQQSTEGVTERIVALFEGGSIREHARKCLDAGVWDADQTYRLAIRGAQSEVRKALKVRDELGLPMFGQTTERNEQAEVIWRQRSLWTVEDYRLNIAERRMQAEACTIEADKLRAEAIAVYGVDPEQDAFSSNLPQAS